MPFLLTYAAVDYAYFALAMSFDKQQRKDARFRDSKGYLAVDNSLLDPSSKGGTAPTYGTLGEKKKGAGDDLDKLFPERVQDQRGVLHRQGIRILF